MSISEFGSFNPKLVRLKVKRLRVQFQSCNRFNPKLVRLKAGAVTDGAIDADPRFNPKLVRLKAIDVSEFSTAYKSFNPKLVRLKATLTR